MAKRIEFTLERFASPIKIDFFMTNSGVKCVFSRLFSVGLLCRFSMLPKVLFCLVVKTLPPWLPRCPIFFIFLFFPPHSCMTYSWKVAQQELLQCGQLYSAGNDAVPRSHPPAVPQGITLLRSNALIKHYALFSCVFYLPFPFVCLASSFWMNMCCCRFIAKVPKVFWKKNLKPVRVTFAQ